MFHPQGVSHDIASEPLYYDIHCLLLYNLYFWVCWCRRGSLEYLGNVEAHLFINHSILQIEHVNLNFK